MHIAYNLIKFNIIFTSKYKTAIPEVFTKIFHIVEKKYNYQIIFIHTNGKKTLTKVYQKKLVLQKSITFETSAFYTLEQNEHIKCQGSIIILKVCTMRIAVNILSDMWLEAVSAAGYISNKMPTCRNSWKTLFKMVTNMFPNLAHLKAYGCKIYI